MTVQASTFESGIRRPARFARRQHGRIDDPGIISFAFAVFGALPLESRLYPASASVFRRQWNLIMGRLGVPFKQASKGATPGVLRGSGATFLYNASEDINWVAWRGRWSRIRTLEYYLQEVGAYLLIHELSSFAKAKDLCALRCVVVCAVACGACSAVIYRWKYVAWRFQLQFHLRIFETKEGFSTVSAAFKLPLQNAECRPRTS